MKTTLFEGLIEWGAIINAKARFQKSHATLSLDRIAAMLTLQERLLEAKSLNEVQYLLVNDVAYLFPSHRLVLFHRGKILAHSNLSDAKADTPYTLWVKKFFAYLEDNYLLASDDQKRINKKKKNRERVLKAIIDHAVEETSSNQSLSEGDSIAFLTQDVQPIYTVTAKDLPKSSEIRQEWSTHWPPYAIVLPLCDHQEHMGYLAFLRDKTWEAEAERKLLIHWAHLTAVVLRNHAKKMDIKRIIPHWKILLPIGMVVLVSACLWFPVRLSVLAEAEVIASAKSFIRSPIKGIISQIHVLPNSVVKQGDVLVSFDQSELQSQLERAKQQLAVAQAELKRTRQQALTARKARFETPVLEAQVNLNQAEVDFYTQELSRAKIIAPHDGIAVLSNPDDWKGRPVNLGEHLLDVITDNGQGIELWLPSADNIPLPEQAPVSLFLHVDPSHVHHAQIQHVSYRAELAPNGDLAFRARATLQNPSRVRVGWRGTAKVSGESVSLGYYLLRRPWMMIRTYLGW